MINSLQINHFKSTVAQILITLKKIPVHFIFIFKFLFLFKWVFNLIHPCLQDSFTVEFVQFLDRGLWYISVYNDGDQAHDVIFSSRFTGNQSTVLIFR